jgi:DNA processing protein
MSDLDKKKYWIALSMVPGVGAISFRKLLNAFESPEQVFAASESSLKAVPGLAEKTIRNILRFGFPDSVKKELDAIERERVHLLTLDDSNYPEQLRNIFDPPPVLYVKGRLPRPHEVMIAVVGSRKSSTYGRNVAESLCRELSLKGVTLVSGMARGIDSAAHRGTLKADGETIAVLGCGVNIIYPPENSRLYHEILERGAIISELSISAKPDRGNFPARNRIISGMSMGTVVVEAGLRSGALITADMALEQGRDVFAVPGNINSACSQGTNRLLKQGAELVEHADDVLNALPVEICQECHQKLQEELDFSSAPTNRASPAQDTEIASLHDHEKLVFQQLGQEPLHIDDIGVRTHLPSATVSASLIVLEMKNLIRQSAGKMFSRR